MAVNIYSQVNWIMFIMLQPLIQYNVLLYIRHCTTIHHCTIHHCTVLLALHLMVLEYKIVGQCFRYAIDI